MAATHFRSDVHRIFHARLIKAQSQISSRCVLKPYMKGRRKPNSLVGSSLTDVNQVAGG